MNQPFKPQHKSSTETPQDIIVNFELKNKKKLLRQLESKRSELLNSLLEVKFENFFQEHP
jgi:hypothetical protein